MQSTKRNVLRVKKMLMIMMVALLVPTVCSGQDLSKFIEDVAKVIVNGREYGNLGEYENEVEALYEEQDGRLNEVLRAVKVLNANIHAVNPSASAYQQDVFDYRQNRYGTDGCNIAEWLDELDYDFHEIQTELSTVQLLLNSRLQASRVLSESQRAWFKKYKNKLDKIYEAMFVILSNVESLSKDQQCRVSREAILIDTYQVQRSEFI